MYHPNMTHHFPIAFLVISWLKTASWENKINCPMLTCIKACAQYSWYMHKRTEGIYESTLDIQHISKCNELLSTLYPFGYIKWGYTILYTSKSNIIQLHLAIVMVILKHNRSHLKLSACVPGSGVFQHGCKALHCIFDSSFHLLHFPVYCCCYILFPRAMVLTLTHQQAASTTDVEHVLSLKFFKILNHDSFLYDVYST